MTNVYAWPPVGLTGWELTTSEPVSRSVGVLGGRPRTSSYLRKRRLATALVTGIGMDLNGAGYVENLKDLLDGGSQLVRVPSLSPIWALARQGQNLVNDLLEWTSGGVDLLWTDGGADLLWGSGDYAMSGTPTTSGGWPALTVSGLPPNVVVARPSERITVTDGTDLEASRVLTAARSNGSGVATIRTFDTFTLSGLVSIGGTESIVFEVLDVGGLRAVQPASGSWEYTFNLREVFEDEYSDGWTEKNPW